MWKLCKTYPPFLWIIGCLVVSQVESVQNLSTTLVDKFIQVVVAKLSTSSVDNLVENCAEVTGISV